MTHQRRLPPVAHLNVRQDSTQLTMKRRNFLELSIAATAFTMMARGAETKTAGERAGGGFRVGKQKDRYEEELLIMGGRFDLKVSSRDTGGDLCIYDTFREAKGGPALSPTPFSGRMVLCYPR